MAKSMLSLIDSNLNADSTQIAQFQEKQYIARRLIYPTSDFQSFSSSSSYFIYLFTYTSISCKTKKSRILIFIIKQVLLLKYFRFSFTHMF